MTIPPDQHDIAAFLQSQSGTAPQETPISAVFVGPDTVWKLKKSVRKPFLDFTTAAARHHFLQRALTLNQPAAPAIYRDIIGIQRAPDGALTFGGTNPVEWVLRMAPIHHFLDTADLTPTLCDAIGDSIAADHAIRPPVTTTDPATALRRITDGNAESARAANLPEQAITAWHQTTHALITHLTPWLTTRAAAGFVRRCHGDLHLGNICLWEGRPTPFDALEFDEALATIDTAYDLAFLLMDLEHRAGRATANRVMNRYLARTGDIDATAGLPLFLSQRAMIRAHVLAANHQDPTWYLQAAQTYLNPPPPSIIAIGGLQGTGKSTLARALAPETGPAPGAVILRSDEIRKRLFHKAPEDRLPPEAYTDEANTRTNDTLLALAQTAFHNGHAVIADSTFLAPTLRPRIAAIGMPFTGLWLQAPLPALEARIAARHNDASDATIAVLRAAAARDPGPGDWLPLDATLPLETLLRLTRPNPPSSS